MRNSANSTPISWVIPRNYISPLNTVSFIVLISEYIVQDSSNCSSSQFTTKNYFPNLSLIEVHFAMSGPCLHQPHHSHHSVAVPIPWHQTPITGDFEASYPVFGSFFHSVLLSAMLFTGSEALWPIDYGWIASRVGSQYPVTSNPYLVLRPSLQPSLHSYQQSRRRELKPLRRRCCFLHWCCFTLVPLILHRSSWP